MRQCLLASRTATTTATMNNEWFTSMAPVSQAAVVWMGVAICVAALLQVVTAPFGRHTSDNWGPTVPNRIGWIVFEAVSPLALWSAYWIAGGALNVNVNAMLMTAWTLHYAHRAFVFPFQIVDEPCKRMPVVVVLAAVFFNCVNGGLNGYHLATASYAPRWTAFVGLMLFAFAALLNIDYDYYLIRQRAENRHTRYVVPQFGLYRLVSCANLFAEVVEWIAFAIAAYPSLPAVSFATWTICNLVPRAVAHHRWYQSKFGSDYPRARKAVIPFLL